ncbi:MAG: S-adenosylmethionine:tRNA ribosyltransferase-isomerase [Flavobacteriales bacterium]|nr:S-adenosylmethionine:tRNA ribosyltransferase-isomerase [Flavobacteriales bacterium]
MHPRGIAIADFTYDLPDARIAQQPLAERDASKLLVYRVGAITDRRFQDLAEELPANALLVLNDTRVVNARLVFHRNTGARIEVLCLDPAGGKPVEQAFAERGSCEWHCFIGNAKRWKEGEELILDDGAIALKAVRSAAERITFTWSPTERSFAEVLDQLGHVPLPPYMKRPDSEADKDRYNTVFAKHDGSVAAPTASLHLSSRVLDELKKKGVRTASLTLHVGAGTFLPVKSERMVGHAMHHEQVRIPLSLLHALLQQIDRGPVVPVGTTALRTLESVYWHGVRIEGGGSCVELDVQQWEPYDGPSDVPAHDALRAVIRRMEERGETVLTGRTQLLIAPGYRFRFADGLVTNFHQPQSTLLLLVAAFVGPGWRKVYDHALANAYRFLSYGDGSVLWRSH